MTIKPPSESPIGVFDSGLGGLTVLKSLEKILPNETFIYFGDTAHVPYGTKSAETVFLYSTKILEFLLYYKTKAVVIACNTASAVAYQKLKSNFDVPLFDVVSPSVEYAIKSSRTRQIGVIGTTSTINSKAYTGMFKEKNGNCKIYEIPCPLFVPIIEEGWSEMHVAKQVAEIYLKEFSNYDLDTLILGCTHYPIMADTIRSVLPDHLQLVFSGETVGNKLVRFLEENQCINTSKSPRKVQFFVTDYPQKFDELGSRFLGRKLNNVKNISLV